MFQLYCQLKYGGAILDFQIVCTKKLLKTYFKNHLTFDKF